MALASAGHARAGLPIVVEYSAPPECASVEAFQALLSVQVSPRADRRWRFIVNVRREGDYVATITTSAVTRELRAPTCDDAVAAAVMVIAVASPDEDPPPPPPPPTMVAPVVAPPVAPVALEPVAPVAPLLTRERTNAPRESGPEYRLGLRAQNWGNNSWLLAYGGSVTASVEPSWGRYRMMFELAVDVLESDFNGLMPYRDPHHAITWGVADFQTCPLDYAFGSTGISLLGCGRLALAANHDSATGPNDSAFFIGAGGRLRWQSPVRLFFEAHVNGVYGTQSAPFWGSPAWLDTGAQVGVHL
jgi:hypothetical protein